MDLFGRHWLAVEERIFGLLFQLPVHSAALGQLHRLGPHARGLSDRCRFHDCTKGCAHTQTRTLGDDDQFRPNKNSFLIMHYKP